MVGGLFVIFASNESMQDCSRKHASNASPYQAPSFGGKDFLVQGRVLCSELDGFPECRFSRRKCDGSWSGLHRLGFHWERRAPTTTGGSVVIPKPLSLSNGT